MFAFSTCWNSHRHTDGHAMLEEIRSLGFEYAELGHGTHHSLLDGIHRAVVDREIKISSLHNFCPLPLGVNGPAPDYYLPSSLSGREHRQAITHTLRTIDYAVTLAAKAVVLHLGRVPMRACTLSLLRRYAEKGRQDSKFQHLLKKACDLRERKCQPFLDAVFRTMESILPYARQAGIQLGIETRLGIEEIPNENETDEIFCRFGNDSLGYWHDVGHAQVRENLGMTSHEVLLERFRGRTIGFHLQDFAPPVFDHRPPGLGTFDFSRLTRFVSDRMILAWEIHPDSKKQQLVPSLKRTQERFLHPVTA